MPSEAATAVAGGCGPAYGASRSANQRRRSARSGSGIPSSSQITVNGSGNAKPATRSTGSSAPRAARAASRSSTIDRIRGSSAATRFGVNAGIASRRSRVWCGGSTASMWRAKAGPGRPSATTSPLWASAACMSLDSRGSFSAAFASSWPTTSQAGCPSASRTSCTGAAERTSANSGNGLSRSWSPHELSAGWRGHVFIDLDLPEAGAE